MMAVDRPKPSLIAARPALVVGAAMVLGAALVVAALVWDRAPTRAQRRSRITDAVDVVTPAPLNDEELRSEGVTLRQERVALESGAWVQVADDQGRLQQRYRARRLDPEPDRWMRMEQPHAVMYPSEGRVVTMRADHGRARIPKRALQSGRLTGNVEIRMYRGRDGGKVIFSGDEPVGPPALVVRSDEAHFDEVLGEIRCEGWVDVVADEVREVGGRTEQRTITFKGEDLLIGVDPAERTIERLVVERPVGPITITKRVAGVSSPSPEVAASQRPSHAVPVEGAPVASVASVASVAGVEAVTPSSPESDPASSGPSGTAIATTAGASTATTPSPSAPAASAATESQRVYRLTLHDHVVIRRIAAGKESIVRGDRLVALFTLAGSGLRDAFAQVSPALPDIANATSLRVDDADTLAPLSVPEWLRVPWPGRVALLAFAAPPASDDEIVTINYEGRLVMLPVDDGTDALPSADDVILRIESLERGGRGFVEVEDVRTLARARCDRLVYLSADESVELEGSTRQPLQVDSPRLSLEGGRFRFDRRSGHGELPGRGRMRLGDREPVSSADASAAASPSGQDSLRPKEVLPPMREVEITWTDRLDIELEDESKKSRIKSAHFKGNVKVDHDDFAFASREMRVEFEPSDAGEGDVSISKIIALGRARATRLSNEGSLVADAIQLRMKQDGQGRPVPLEMRARGEVEAVEKTQTLWSDDLLVKFEPRAAAGDATAAAARDDRSALPLGAEMGEVEVTTVLAGTLREMADDDGAASTDARPDGGVQVLLRDGARVFAHRLDGNARDRRVKLEGPDVMIVQKNVVADGLMHLDIDEGKGTITAQGPGRFRHFRQPIVDDMPSPRTRPAPTGPVSMEAKWSESMKFNDRANAGGGSIDLEGDVRVRASRTDREFSALDAKVVQIDLRNDPRAKATTAMPTRVAGDATETPGSATDAGGKAAPSTESGLIASGTRSIERLIAKDHARLESQTWPTDERVGRPRLFRVTGDHVEYDTLTGEAKVVGNGTLLVHDESERGGAGGAEARGSSRFKWGSTMDMVRLGAASQEFLITMNDGVEVIHQGLNDADSMTLTCRTLETTVRRPGFGDPGRAAAPPNPMTGELASSAGVDLGGPAEVRRVRGLGQVFVRAPEADIECEEFDYDLRTQIAQLKARDGRLVTVLRRDSPTPIRAASVIWDRATGKMTIQSGSGAISR